MKVRFTSAAGRFTMACLLSLLFTSATAEAQFTVTTNAGSVTIIGYDGPPGPVVIPESIDGWPVGGVSSAAFQGNADITSVTVPATLTSIASGAFAVCTAMTQILVDPANSSYSAADGVLFDKAQTTLLQFPAGKGGGYSIPTTVTNVGFRAFKASTTLTNIVIPDSVTAISDEAFSNCSGLTTVVIPESIRNIGYATFSSCARLAAVSIPNTVTNIGPYSFTFCGLTNLVLPEGLVTVTNVSFAYCDKLISVRLPKSLKSIGVYAFSSCTSLKEIYFEGDRPTIGTDAFSNVTQMTAFYAPGSTGWATYTNSPAVLWNASPVKNSAVNSAPGQFAFEVAGNSGLRFVVEMTAELTNPIWIPVITNVTTSSPLMITNAQPIGAARFYRVRSP